MKKKCWGFYFHENVEHMALSNEEHRGKYAEVRFYLICFLALLRYNWKIKMSYIILYIIFFYIIKESPHGFNVN